MFPGRASLFLERLFLSPRRPDPRVYERAKIFRDAAEMRLPYGGRWLQTWSWGAGPVIFIVHGWSGHAAQLAGFVAPLVARGYRVVALDAPAHGRSGGERTDLIDFAGSLVHAAGHYGQPAAVLAHSFGAPAAALALDTGLATARLVLIAPPVSLESFSRAIARLVGFPRAVQRRMQERIEKRFGLRWKDLETDRILKRVAATRALSLMVVHDRGDREVTWESGVQVSQAVKGASLLSTDGLGHNRILRDTGVIEAVSDYLGPAEQAQVA